VEGQGGLMCSTADSGEVEARGRAREGQARVMIAGLSRRDRRVHDNVLDLIGNTPMIRLRARPSSQGGIPQPRGSVKDRVALAMIEERRARPAQARIHRSGADQRQHGDRRPLVGGQGYRVRMSCREHERERKKLIVHSVHS